MNLRARTLRNTMFSSVAMYTEYVLGMVTSIVIARHLGPEGFGAYGAAIWLVGMGVAATNSGTATTAIRFVAELRGAGREALVRPLVAYLRRVQRTFLAVVLAIGALALWLAGSKVAPGFDHRLLFGFLVVSIALRSSYMFNIGVAKGLEDFRINARVALVAAPLNLVLAALVAWLDKPVEWQLGVFLVSGAVFFAMSWTQVQALLPPGDRRPALPADLVPRIRRQMLYATMIVTVGFVVASEVEVMFLNAGGLVHDAGQFKVGYQLASGAATLVPGVFAALLLPMMASALTQGRTVAGHRFAASTAYLTLLAAPLTTFGIALSGALVHVLYGARYDSASTVFALCLAGSALLATAQGATSLLISADRQRLVLILIVTCGLSKLALDAWLIHVDGLRGALVAFAVVAVFNVVANFALAIRECGVAPDWARLGRIVLAGLCASAPAALLAVWLPPFAALLAGAACAATYLPWTLALRCWSRNDIAHMLQLHAQLMRGRPRFLARLFAWGDARLEMTA